MSLFSIYCTQGPKFLLDFAKWAFDAKPSYTLSVEALQAKEDKHTHKQNTRESQYTIKRKIRRWMIKRSRQFVYVCVCVREREKEKGRKRQTLRGMEILVKRQTEK